MILPAAFTIRDAVALAVQIVRLTNEWDGQTHDYTHKPGIVHTEIMLPAHAPMWMEGIFSMPCRL